MMGIVEPETFWAYKKYNKIMSPALACIPDTNPAYPHLTSNIQQTKDETTNVVINIIVASSWWWA